MRSGRRLAGRRTSNGRDRSDSQSTACETQAATVPKQGRFGFGWCAKLTATSTPCPTGRQANTPYSAAVYSPSFFKKQYRRRQELALKPGRNNGNAESERALDRIARHCRSRGVVIPTFAQLAQPDRSPAAVRQRLRAVGLWDVDPANLFRITWKNEPTERGGGFNQGNWIEFPPALTGVPARIVGLLGRWFPTGAHKVGAAFGCLVPRLVRGEFDPTTQKAVWPSTGNFCRGGAFDCALLGCTPVAILPEEMSPERFEWLRSVGAEVIATPGCESNVKEIYDKCWEIRRSRADCVIFNQFEEFGNACWHYHVTGGMVAELFARLAGPRDRLSAFISATGSAGTIAAGDFLRTQHGGLRIVAVEALQCPTLLRCGFGAHRIEGIGDKHVPWIHNVRNTDVVVAVDDAQCLALMRLFNEPAGHEQLAAQGVSGALVEQLPQLGISGICNLVAAIKTARYFEMDGHDVLFVPLTDSMDLYRSRVEEQRRLHGPYSPQIAGQHTFRYLYGVGIDHMRELGYHDRLAIHNLKYFTWVEQQQRSVEDLRRLWDPSFWTDTYAQVAQWDADIEAFNARIAAASP
ncbi:MAG: pyridoxal-phosphate dependent enzyme [Planctomycetes bacterium]|nr:pyridoxal-phosphate dependent enzyme [Planctomycetota bacterium]